MVGVALLRVLGAGFARANALVCVSPAYAWCSRADAVGDGEWEQIGCRVEPGCS